MSDLNGKKISIWAFHPAFCNKEELHTRTVKNGTVKIYGNTYKVVERFHTYLNTGETVKLSSYTAV